MRRLAGVLAAVLMTGLTVASAIPSWGEVDDDGLTGALEAYGACLAGAGQGDLILLVDASRSLRETDPDGDRSKAAEILLEELRRGAAETPFTVSVQVATFASDYAVAEDWTILDDRTLPALVGAVEGLADESAGVETDYWTALEGARRALEAHRTAEGRACQAIAWFTDGQLDIDVKSVTGLGAKDAKGFAPDNPLTTQEDREAAIVEAGTQLCRPGGLADQLRSLQAPVFGIALAGGGDDAEFDLMRGIATGTVIDSVPGLEGSTCGAIVDPAPGEFVEAGDPEALRFAFNTFANPAEPPVETELPVCQGEPCEEGAHRLVLDDSISSVSILASGAADGLDVYLVPPGGEPFALARAEIDTPVEAEVGGAAATWTWQTDRMVAIDLARGASSWAGAWTIAFVDPDSQSEGALSRTQIRVRGGLRPTWSAGDDAPVHAGETLAGTTLGLEDAAGQAVDPASLLGEVSLDVSLVDPSGRVTPVATGLGKDQMGQPLDIDLTDAADGEHRLRLRLQVTTAGTVDATGAPVPGTPFAPAVTEWTLRVAPPVGYPEVSDADFGTLDGILEADASIRVVGEGCAWLAGTATLWEAYPDRLGDIQLSTAHMTADTCVEAASGEGAELTLHLAVESSDSGTLAGELPVMIAPPGEPDRAIAKNVKLTADFRRPPNAGVLWAVFAALMVLGPGLPMAGLLAVKAATAKVPGDLYAEAVDVQVRDGQVWRDGQEFEVRPSDFRHMVDFSAGRRSFAVGGVAFRVKVGWNPFGAASVVTASGPAASSAHLRPVGKDHHAVLPLALGGQWVMLAHPLASDGAATVVMFTPPGAGPARAEAIAAAVEADGPDMHRVLLEAAGAGDRGEDDDEVRDAIVHGSGEGDAPRRGGVSFGGEEDDDW